MAEDKNIPNSNHSQISGENNAAGKKGKGRWRIWRKARKRIRKKLMG